MLNGHRPATPYLAACLDEALGADGEIIAAASMAAAASDAARLPLRELADHAAELGQLTMVILGGACAVLVEAAELIVWSNDRRRARLHPDPDPGLAGDEPSWLRELMPRLVTTLPRWYWTVCVLRSAHHTARAPAQCCW